MGSRIVRILLIVATFLQCYQSLPIEGDKHKISGIAEKINPKRYTLSFQIFPEEETFTGEVVIKVVAIETTNVISLSAHKDLTIQDTTEVVLSASDTTKTQNIEIQKITRPVNENVFNIELKNPVNEGAEFEVKLKFSGKINTQTAEGLFKKQYKDDVTGQTRWIIGSQLKPRLSISVFPCFKNPSFKVPFDVSIQRPSSVNSLSTMPLLESKDMGAGWILDKFVSTPPMAAHSLAIFVSDLTSATYDKQGLKIRIWATPELLQTIKENRSEMIYNGLNMYAENFGIKYPLPELDYIVLPFSAGTSVSSSWGLIISSKHELEDDTTQEEVLISSELVNQWIGNLVTPSTSDDDIAVSALAKFCSEYYSSKKLVKENENVLERWPLGDLYANYYEFGNPISSNDEDIKWMTAIDKAVMVYRMLAYTLTDSTFATALKSFITNKQFKSFEIDELWETLTKHAYLDGNLPTTITVKQIVIPWLMYDRVPFITLTRDYKGDSDLLTQAVFLREQPHNDDEDALWSVPIVLIQQDQLYFTNTKPSFWMFLKNHTFNAGVPNNQFIIINPEEIAEYMVNYDKTNWNMLADFLQSSERTKIPVMTRAKLIHDALNLAYAGELDFGTALNMTVYLKSETSYVAWNPLFIMYDHIGRHIDGTTAHKKLQRYLSSLIKPLYEHLKSTHKEEDKQSNEFLRKVKAQLVVIGDDNLIKEANSVYEEFMKNPSKGYKDAMKYLCNIYEYGTDEQWEFGFKTLRNLPADLKLGRSYLLKTLVGCTKDSRKIKKFLNTTLFEQERVFTDDDFDYSLVMLTGGAAGYKATFEYLNENWDALKARLQDKPDIWKQLIYTATNLYKTQDGLQQVSEFYSKHQGQFGEAETTIQNSLKKIKEEVKWTNANLNTLENWLDEYLLKNNQ